MIRLAVLLAWVGSPLLTFGEDWLNWRGPHYDGHSRETGFIRSWEQLDPVWAQHIGAGFSGISCTRDRVYTCGTADENQVLTCLNADSGAVLWKTPIGARYWEPMGGSGPRSTPTVDGDRVYVMGARGLLVCCAAESGALVWSREFDAVPQWGYSGSVLIQDRLAIVNTGGAGGGMRALDKLTGAAVWSCGDDADAGYATPYPFQFAGVNYVCGFLGNSLVVADRDRGRPVLTLPWKTDWKVNAATPIFHNGYLFVSSGYRTGCAVYQLSPAGSQLQATEVWRSKALLNKFQTPVLHQGRLYSFDQTAFKCVDFMTGKALWKQHGKHGTVIVADDQLITLSQEGQLQIGGASPAGFTPTGSARILDDRCWTVPTLSHGRLYARNLEGRLVCINLRPADPSRPPQ